jgi:drug/metabolite transporter (DMT)-like permease
LKSSEAATPAANLQTSTHTRKGYLLAAAAAVMWGTSGVMARFLFSNNIRPYDLLLIRTLGAALIYWIWLSLAAPQLLKVERRDWPRLAIFGIVGLTINQGCYYLALKLTSVSYALLLQYTAPLMLMAYGVVSKTENFTSAKLTAGVLALCGCALMMLGQAGGYAAISLPGTLGALGSACAFAFYSAYGKRVLQRHDSRTAMLYAFTFASLAWLVVWPVWTIEWQAFDRRAWLFVLYLSALATVLPFGLYLASLRYLEPSRANLTSGVEPVVAATLAWIWLGEEMSVGQMLGGVAVLCGVVMLQMEHRMWWARRR